MDDCDGLPFSQRRSQPTATRLVLSPIALHFSTAHCLYHSVCITASWQRTKSFVIFGHIPLTWTSIRRCFSGNSCPAPAVPLSKASPTNRRLPHSDIRSGFHPRFQPRTQNTDFQRSSPKYVHYLSERSQSLFAHSLLTRSTLPRSSPFGAVPTAFFPPITSSGRF
jgi:hypothetical protein